MKPVGLYVHFPFCHGKCPYCDFYSLSADREKIISYTEQVISTLKEYRSREGFVFDTVYFGGGTPSLVGKEIISRLAREITVSETAAVLREFTVECNPSQLEDGFFEAAAESGINRISMGLQSAVDAERKALGRRASPEDVMCAVKSAHASGIKNISLDLMLGVPNQTKETLRRSVEFCARSGAVHVSAYILKIEEGTYFFKHRDKLSLPNEDECCELYLYACELLESFGFMQYEISNFAVTGFESRHNLKYWNDEEYLGIGPAAHSFINGKRFYYERDLDGFVCGAMPVSDGSGGDFDEYAMLRLRLTDGLSEAGTKSRFGYEIPDTVRKAALPLSKAGLLTSDSDGIRLTRNGFLLSNAIIGGLLSNAEK